MTLRQILLSSFLILFVIVPRANADWDKQDVAKQKQRAIEKLKERRAGFEEFLERKEQWDKRRLRRADDQKVIRQKYSEQREKARREFVRAEDSFPYKDYRNFLQAREKRREKLEKVRKEFSKMSKELNKIYEDDKYQIDGNKEYEL